ncbi:NAD(P)/FAD-dependent oxidoreductase [Nocardia australiensis]|uniref:NAD(P)/FAD-dependent oxidoreductase n=1 Tax=Nocardia australiensis TaxID=2887191 RepID=UPI001D14E7FB|nr:FAD-dependent oxidoreductase [Nocardia australiensis]
MSSADSIRTVTVVGGGLAGFTVARELRSRGFDGVLRIVDPQGIPYDRPPLSKAYLDGQANADALHLAPVDWFAENAVEIVDDSAVKLFASRRSVMLASGGELASDALVLSTGGQARRLAIPGGDLPGVVTLRTREDADLIRTALRPGCALVIVGAGLIGAEVAATATKAGARVTLIDPIPVPLVPAVGEELAEALHSMHAANGVDIIVGTPTRVVSDGQSLLVDIERQGGFSRVAADMVLVAIGIEVDTALADSAELVVDTGIEVNASGETSNPAIWAAGDGIRVRDADGTLRRRSEHWEAAIISGTAAACGIVGEHPAERPPAWFWSDRYGVHVEAVGSMNIPGFTVVREYEGAVRVAFRVDTKGVLVGCAAIDEGRVLRAAKRLIAQGARLEPDYLTDPKVDLRKIGKELKNYS